MGVGIRLNKAAKELGVGVKTITDFLNENGIECDGRPSSKIDESAHDLLLEHFSSDKKAKEKSKNLSAQREERVTISIEDQVREKPTRSEDYDNEVVIKNISVAPVVDLPSTPKPVEEKEAKPAEEVEAKKEVEKGEKSDTPNVVGKIDLASLNLKTRPDKKKKEKPAPKPSTEETKAEEVEEVKDTKPETPVESAPVEKKPKVVEAPEKIETKVEKLSGPKITGEKIDLTKFQKPPKKSKPVASSNSDKETEAGKRKRKRIHPSAGNAGKNQGGGRHGQRNVRGRKGKAEPKPEVTQESIQKEIKDTLARLSSSGTKSSRGAKHRKAKREAQTVQQEELLAQQEAEKTILRVTEFVTANELATLMSISVNDVIGACMSLGLFVSINQRLDAETISIVAEEFGFTVEFTGGEDEEEISLMEDDVEDRVTPRPPIVTIMGHVDHGKTSLLDYIREANVIAGEAGGITQHIGAYQVEYDGKLISFLDTPGHEAFTAMRSRGAQVTDVVIIVIAADDSIMPQTTEAINHAQAAGVPIIFAINKIDKPGANPEKIKEELASKDLLVEEWGGKYQSQDISAKNGTNVEELLEKVLLEAELLELQADPRKRANGTVLEASLDKGKGYVSTLLVQEGKMNIGDIILAGANFGKVKAMYNERGQNIKEVYPSGPVSILGLNGAPSAGDKFYVMEDEREAKNIAQKRSQLQREQGVRTKKHITLDEIGRRIAIGDFQELNIIVKGDVDGSIEALSDSMLNLSTEKIQVNVIHKSVGQISESDVLLASASDAIIVGFQVRPSAGARALAEQEEIDIRLYSIIYAAIDEVKLAMQGMLKPTFEEKIVCTIDIRETFKISKVGTIAGCYVTSGTVTRNTKIRLLRDGIVVYTGSLGSLKRFKDDVKEVKKGFECGLNIENYNDIKVGDIIEGFEQVEVETKL
ncbi:MAG: translation initiation factor IF-2 [Crocinitomicaceae bacterium]|nr:translation initiation factor IF-2 [Crocinitomicaceae bacterium]|tara:strand:- start:57262 stop:60051 length:2790 start_codon:yes stop_codon:yes gene_type:complete